MYGKLRFIKIIADGKIFEGYELNREAPVVPGFIAIHRPVDNDDTIYLNRDRIIMIEVDPIEIEEMFNIFQPKEIKIRD